MAGLLNIINFTILYLIPLYEFKSIIKAFITLIIPNLTERYLRIPKYFKNIFITK